MKEKLEKVRDVLKFYTPGNYLEGGGVGGDKRNNFETDYGNIAIEGVALLDSIISMLDSPELVEKVAALIRRDLTDRRGIRQAIEQCDDEIQQEIFITNAKAAIESIRDKDNG